MKEQKEVKVTKMVIQLTDEQISLSMPEAKKLYEALAELFGKKTIEHHYDHDYWWYRPYRWYGSTYDLTTIKATCKTDNSSASKSINALSEYKSDSGALFIAKGSVLMCNLNK